MKYALLIAFTYDKNIYGDSRVSKLVGTCNDIRMMTIFAKHKGIPSRNITILSDLSELPRECLDCNIKYNPYPESEFVCRELAQFIENTIRGIEDETCKTETDIPEVLIYISGHGGRIKVTIPEIRDEQGIVLLDNGGLDVKYLTTKDLFNILFGRFPISNTGLVEIPIYNKNIRLKPKNINGATRYEEEIISDVTLVSVYLSHITESPSNSPGMTVKPLHRITKNYRSTYLSNRGIPPWSRVLFIIDTCHSANMTHFPYIYSPRDQEMNSYHLENIFVSHTDMPFCVSISSCDVDKTTKSAHEGSQLTQVIYSQLRNVTETLNFSQFYFYIVNSGNSIFRSFFSNSTLTPVLSSTCNNSDALVPFFSDVKIVLPRKVIK